MNTELILAIIGIAATPVTGWLASKLTRQKYAAEIAKLRADVASADADASRKELENSKFGHEIIMENIVRPLKNEMKYLRNDIKRFRKAIEQIPRCPLADECPVSRELLADEKGDDGEPADDK